MQANEQPGLTAEEFASETKKRWKEKQEADPQFQAFKARVVANLAVPFFDEKALQFYIEHPNLIPDALSRAFNNQVAGGGHERVRKFLESYIWNFSVPGVSIDLREKKLIIWLLRQSKDLVEPVVLDYSVYHDSFNQEPLDWPAKAAHLVNNMQSSNLPQPNLYHLFHAEGVHLHLKGSTHDGHGATFFFTKEHYSIKGARKLMWNDALLGIEGIEEPK